MIAADADPFLMDYIDKVHHIRDTLGVSFECASDVVYLRTSQHHTDELEKKLIDIHTHVKPPDLYLKIIDLFRGIF